MLAKYVPTILLGALMAGQSHATEWTIDQAHSSIGFSVKHMVVSTVRGSFGKFEGKVTFDPAKPASFNAELTIDVKSIYTGVEKRDEHLRNSDFFDAEKYPQIKYKSKKLESLGNSRYRVTGDLTMRGVTKEVVLEGEGFGSTYKTPRGKTVTAVSARGTINREDFGIMYNAALESGGVVVGREVTLEIELELIKGE